jgi:hypothetical protein
VSYVLWALVLMLQAGSSTWASRARNTGSVGYHAVAAVFSHGVWFVSLYLIVDKTKSAQTAAGAVAIGVFYTTFCVIGSVVAHYVSQNYLEQGKRVVGAK